MATQLRVDPLGFTGITETGAQTLQEGERRVRSASQDRFLRVESMLQRAWFTDALSLWLSRTSPSVKDVLLWTPFVDQHYHIIAYF